MKRAKEIAPHREISPLMTVVTPLMDLQSPVKLVRDRAEVNPCMAKIDAFFNLMFEQKASDLHLASGNPPILRINGELHRVDFPPLESDSLKAMLYEITPE